MIPSDGAVFADEADLPACAEQPVVDNANNANNAAAEQGERRALNNGVGTRVPIQFRRD